MMSNLPYKQLIIKKYVEGPIHVAMTNDEVEEHIKTASLSSEEKEKINLLFFSQYDHLYEVVKCSTYFEYIEEEWVPLNNISK
jgi:hypothetical protein